MTAEPASLLPGEQDALQQSAVAGGPGTKARKLATLSASGGGPKATSTPAVLKSSSKKKHAQPVCSLLYGHITEYLA